MLQPSLKGLSVLIVDGHSLSAAEISGRLIALGARVHVVASAAAAILFARAKRLDVAMLGSRAEAGSVSLRRTLDEQGVPYIHCDPQQMNDCRMYDRVFSLALPAAA